LFYGREVTQISLARNLGTPATSLNLSDLNCRPFGQISLARNLGTPATSLNLSDLNCRPFGQISLARNLGKNPLTMFDTCDKISHLLAGIPPVSPHYLKNTPDVFNSGIKVNNEEVLK